MKQYSLCPRICCRPGQYLVTDEQDKFYVRPPQPSRERWYLTVIRLIGPQVICDELVWDKTILLQFTTSACGAKAKYPNVRYDGCYRGIS
jgi:hypothetical protein